MRLVREAHGVGKGVVPRALVVDRVALRIASRQRLDQRPFRRGGPAGQRGRRVGRVMSAGERRGLAGGGGPVPRGVRVGGGCWWGAPAPPPPPPGPPGPFLGPPPAPSRSRRRLPRGGSRSTS